MKKSLWTVLLSSLIVLATSAAQRETKPTKLTCTLTKKAIEKCCCVQQKDGKLYCTLAKKVVDPCCCKEEPAK
jgi:hypothetical protein